MFRKNALCWTVTAITLVLLAVPSCQARAASMVYGSAYTPTGWVSIYAYKTATGAGGQVMLKDGATNFYGIVSSLSFSGNQATMSANGLLADHTPATLTVTVTGNGPISLTYNLTVQGGLRAASVHLPGPLPGTIWIY